MAASTAMRWVLRYAPEFEKRWQGYEKPVGLSWRVDETYLKVGGRSRSARLQHHPVFRSSTRSPRGTEGAGIRRDPTSTEEPLLSPKQGAGIRGGPLRRNGPSMNTHRGVCYGDSTRLPRADMRTPACGLSITLVVAGRRCRLTGASRRLIVKDSSNPSSLASLLTRLGTPVPTTPIACEFWPCPPSAPTAMQLSSAI